MNLFHIYTHIHTYLIQFIPVLRYKDEWCPYSITAAAAIHKQKTFMIMLSMMMMMREEKEEEKPVAAADIVVVVVVIVDVRERERHTAVAVFC